MSSSDETETQRTATRRLFILQQDAVAAALPRLTLDQVNVLSNFMSPRDPDRVPNDFVDVLGGGTPPSGVIAETINVLLRQGLLTAIHDDDGSGIAVALCRAIARRAEVVGGALALSPGGINAEARGGVHRVLEDLLGTLDGLEAQLRVGRHERTKARLSELGIDPQSRGLKLHLGSAACRLDGWIGIDLRGADLPLNLNWGLPLADGAVTHVYASQVLEHFTYRGEAIALLREVRRVLEPNDGIVRLVVPDLETYIRAYAEGDDEFFSSHKQFFAWAQTMRTPLEYLLATSGSPMIPADFFGHKWGYDWQTLQMLLSDAGFSRIQRCSLSTSQDPILKIDQEASPDATFGSRRHNYNLFVEAQV
jgi:hypothetical protein